MLDIALFITLFALGLRAFLGLRRESAVRREFGQSGLLDVLVLLYPLGPIVLLVGSLLVPRVALLVCVGAFFIAAWVASSKQREALERAGTDRVKDALAATSSATLGAMVGTIYIGVACVFAFLSYAIGSQSIGA